MSGPFKMKYTRENKSAFPFKENPLKMYGGMKASPARSWWNKIKNVAAGVAQKVKGAFGGGGDEDGGGGGGFGGLMGMGRGGGGLMGMGRGRRGFSRMHDRAHAGEGGAEGAGQQGPQKWSGGGDGGDGGGGGGDVWNVGTAMSEMEGMDRTGEREYMQGLSKDQQSRIRKQRLRDMIS